MKTVDFDKILVTYVAPLPVYKIHNVKCDNIYMVTYFVSYNIMLKEKNQNQMCGTLKK